MFDNIKANLNKKKEKRLLRKLKIKEEKAIMEEEVVAEKMAKIKTERETLLSMEDKELKVEIIMAIRGFYSELENLKLRQKELDYELAEIKRDIAHLEVMVD